MKRKILVKLILSLLVVPVIANAEIYKWVDEEGRTHYGEKPPAENADKIEIRESPATDTVQQHQSVDQNKLLQIYEEERNLKKTEQLKVEKEKAERKKQCEALAAELNNLKQGGVFYDLDENGKRIYYSEPELTAYTEKLQADYDKHCQ